MEFDLHSSEVEFSEIQRRASVSLACVFGAAEFDSCGGCFVEVFGELDCTHSDSFPASI